MVPQIRYYIRLRLRLNDTINIIASDDNCKIILYLLKMYLSIIASVLVKQIDSFLYLRNALRSIESAKY